MSKIEDGGPAFPFGQVSEQTGMPINGYHNDGMSMRQYAAIKLRVPNSGTDWLDEMIRTSLHDDLAAKAMQTLISGGVPHTVEKDERELNFSQWVAKNAHRFADAMPAARGEEK